MQFELNQSMKQTQNEWRDKSLWYVLFIVIGAWLVLEVCSLYAPEFKINQSSYSTETVQLIDIFMKQGRFGILLILLLLLNKYKLKSSTGSLGYYKQHCIRNYGIGAAIGGVSIFLTYLLCLMTGGVQTVFSANTSVLIILGYLIGFGIQGMTEEVLTRSFIMNVLSAKKNVAFGIIINSIFFSLMHSPNPGLSFLALINLFLIGIFFSMLFYWSSNIWVAGAAHSLWNFVQGPVLGANISGESVPNSLFVTDLFDHQALFNGGNFGLEGGLFVSLITIIACVILWLLCQKKGLIH